MIVRNHGGGCCGIRHLSEFLVPYGGVISDAQIEQLHLDIQKAPSGRAVEVVLTDSRSRVWAPILTALGFTPVYRFRNSNTGNLLTVYYYHRRSIPVRDLPFSIEPSPRVGGVTQKPLTMPPGIGQRVRVLSTRSYWHGHTGIVCGIRDRGIGTFVKVESGGFTTWVLYTNLAEA